MPEPSPDDGVLALMARDGRGAGRDRLVRLVLTARRRLPPLALGRPAPGPRERARPGRPSEDDETADDDMTEAELDQLIGAMEGLLVEIRAGAIPHTMA